MITIDKYVNVSEKRMELIEEIADLVANDLGLKSIDIKININPSVDMEGYDGFCYSANLIDIVNKRETEQLFKVIAHELRHAYQYKNDLVGCDGKWRGKKYKFYDGSEVDAVEYENVMWEKHKKSLTSL